MAIKTIVKRTLLAALAIGAVFIVNLIFFRPFFIGHFYEKVFVEFAIKNPQILTGMGIKLFYDQLNDNSQEAADANLALLKKDFAQLQAYDRDGLEGQQALSYDILHWFLQDQMQGEAFRDFNYSVTQRGGAYQGLLNFMVNMHKVDDEGDAEDYLARIAQFATVMDNTLIQVEREQSVGAIPPKFIITKILENLHNIRDPELSDNELVKDFNTKVDALEDLESAAAQALKDQMLLHMSEIVNPAYDRFIAFYQDLHQRANNDAGVWKFERGEEFYQYRIQTMTTTNYSADELHALGLTEVDRIVNEMDAILRGEGYTEGSVGERMLALNEEPHFLYPDTDEGREAILAKYRELIEEADGAMDAYFSSKPKAQVEVRKVPEYRQKTAAGGSYQGPSLDGSRPGIFYANLYDIKATPKFGMRTLTYHEAIPGHHFQIATMTELEGLPTFRNVLGFTSYSEGWALYSELVAYEAGLQADPFDNLGRLQAELFRAVRLVVDTGIHHKRWTREAAIDYMASTTGMALTDVESEIERYIVWPGQALAYKVGMLKILELRERAQTELGDNFDIKAFHDTVLKNGAMPMSILDKKVNEYIETTRAKV